MRRSNGAAGIASVMAPGPRLAGVILAAALVSISPAWAAELTAIFEILDENGDGVVDRGEFQRQKTVIFLQELGERPASASLSPADTNLTAEAFAQADIDGDGMLSGAEYVQGRFAQYDTYDPDGNGAITLEEFRARAAPFIRS